jgi:IS30 family transposase
MELRERGWSILAAARQVGVSRTTGNDWTRGYKTYRRGEAVGFVAPLDRLAVRQISSRFLSQDERIEIADLHRFGVSVRQIAARLGRSPSTVSRELRRNATAGGEYRPFEAHRRATARRARRHRRRVDRNEMLRLLLEELLGQRWSPQQISRLCAGGSPTSQRCGCATRASTRPSTSPDRRFGVPRSWLRSAARRYTPAGTTDEPSSAPTRVGHGSSSRCSPSTSAHSLPKTVPKPATGKAT